MGMKHEVATHHARDRAGRPQAGNERIVAEHERGDHVRQRRDHARRILTDSRTTRRSQPDLGEASPIESSDLSIQCVKTLGPALLRLSSSSRTSGYA